MNNRLRLLVCGLVAVCIALVVITAASADSPVGAGGHDPTGRDDVSSVSLLPQATPEPELMADPFERLKRPPMSDPPTQVELGHYIYYLSCMVCHGDRGQGLTDEWRTVLDPADRNCWQSKCHAANHPPEGFEIPRAAPAVIGPGTLTTYQTAADLFEYIRVTMPWPYPGLYEDEEYWNLTAYLADANGVAWGPEPLGPEKGPDVLLIPELVQIHGAAFGTERVVTVVVVGLLMGTVILHRWSRAR
ncbi:MAG: hypothetical protein JSV36_09235 [Anaerolineae bacterium]|nr:MAG: hypothetical protein JSV36_09235 [Anaerolineae bacterium]